MSRDDEVQELMITPALRRDILEILQGATDVTIATLREDGYPQATTVSFASEDLDLYFGTAAGSQKVRNLSRNDKVPLTINLPYADWGDIRGISASGRAERLTDTREIEKAGQLLLQKFSKAIAEYTSGGLGDIAFFRIRPEVISVLDYRKGFGHTETVAARGVGASARAFTRASWPERNDWPGYEAPRGPRR